MVQLALDGHTRIPTVTTRHDTGFCARRRKGERVVELATVRREHLPLSRLTPHGFNWLSSLNTRQRNRTFRAAEVATLPHGGERATCFCPFGLASKKQRPTMRAKVALNAAASTRAVLLVAVRTATELADVERGRLVEFGRVEREHRRRVPREGRDAALLSPGHARIRCSPLPLATRTIVGPAVALPATSLLLAALLLLTPARGHKCPVLLHTLQIPHIRRRALVVCQTLRISSPLSCICWLVWNFWLAWLARRHLGRGRRRICTMICREARHI